MHKKSNEPVDTSHGYELSDLSIKQIAIGVVGFFIFVGVSGILGVIFLWLPFDRARVPADDQFQSRRLPPEPNPMVQNNTTAATDIWNLRARENSVLNSYGWSEHTKGVAHIPIEQAIEMEAQAKSGSTNDFDPGSDILDPTANGGSSRETPTPAESGGSDLSGGTDVGHGSTGGNVSGGNESSGG